ncbi:hypothetical protein GCM10023347_33830 [Streptomyces chumphonensis]|uniref:Uncharacterized protein n=1 Tax=Streptomyces chumphonensis TaxID=1214925 RepID=A0A927EYF0_9ACTN|nr:hypothetical protein [Streptomyces chumphonensis]MBD3931946.1 hypothetical protein [Streptomyces chumphonensis]
MPEYAYTRTEKAERTRLLIKGARGAYGDTSAVEAAIERIDARAADRGAREARAWAAELDQARNAVATARVAERTADPTERRTAREARKAAETRLRRVERARR